MEIRRLASALLVAGLALTACSGGDQPPPSAGGNAEVGTTNDMNPQDPASLRDGGDLRVALASFPENFNVLHIDGNTGDSVFPIMRPTMPRSFVIAADGTATVNHDYFTDVALTGTNPQVVTYTINPKAIWSDGTPITWEDIASQVNATKGSNKAFLIAGPNGSERVASVTRGVDDRQAIMTFAKPYAEWKGLFAGNGFLLPKSVTATPEAFNKGFLNGPPPSAGPFIITTIDRGAQRLTLTRNPKWWGTTPRLNSIS
jgi:peptide/nickel transport system substrate-binding protein